jgi:hypothetical protein
MYRLGTDRRLRRKERHSSDQHAVDAGRSGHRRGRRFTETMTTPVAPAS